MAAFIKNLTILKIRPRSRNYVELLVSFVCDQHIGWESRWESENDHAPIRTLRLIIVLAVCQPDTFFHHIDAS